LSNADRDTKIRYSFVDVPVARAREVSLAGVSTGAGPSAAGEGAEPDLLTLSIIVPVRNEQAHIRRTLEMLLEQEYPTDRFEILVVDGESTDRTAEIVDEFIARGEPVRRLSNPKRWSSAARNVGVRSARGDVVLVIDGHCELPHRRHLRAVCEAFQQSGAAVLGRPQPLTVRNATPLQRAIAIARASRLGHHPDSYIYTSHDRFVPAQSVGAAYRADVFRRIGDFDERFDACEDVDFNYRADRQQLPCFLAAEAVVHYQPRTTLSGLFCQLARYGRGRVRLGRKHPGTLGWKSLAPAALVLCLAVAALLSPLSDLACWMLALLAGGYALAVFSVSLGLAWKLRPGRAALWLPAVFATIHLAAGVGVLHELFLGRRDMRDPAGD
jgi:succinoglycan biosynthesis protein ExoA